MALPPYIPPEAGKKYVWYPLNEKQQAALNSKAEMLLFGGASGGGKMLDLTTPIPTPQGWTLMGDLQTGDEVFTETGAVCHVAIAHDVVINPKSYVLAFDDGSSMVACADHKWAVYDAASRTSLGNAGLTRYSDNWPVWRSKRGKGCQILSTESISKNLEVRPGYKNYSVPVCAPLDMPDSRLELDPFVLGVFLGDGSHTKGSTRVAADQKNGDQELVRREFAHRGYTTNDIADPFSFSVPGISHTLRVLGLHLRKHVPRQYFRASIAQRLDLLRGLMITDGTITEAGHVSFDNINEELVDATFELATSLGQKPRKRLLARSTMAGNRCWRVYWTPTIDVFGIGRKSARLKLGGAQFIRSLHRMIVRCEPCKSVPMRCISVDNPTGLYLAGRQMVPTHNSDYLVADAMQERDNSNFRGLLLRKSYTEMNNLIDRMEVLYRPFGASKKDGGKKWVFPSGAQVRLGYMAKDDDVSRYQGNPYTWLGVDEAGNQPERRIRRILPWLASTDPTLRVRARLTANPGGVGSAWLMRLFLRDKCPVHFPQDSVEPGRRYAGKGLTWSDGVPVEKTVSFIPSRVEDNPLYGDQKIKALRSQEAVLAEQLLRGCWCALEGMYFRFLNESYGATQAEVRPQYWWTYFISIDYGFGSSAAAAGLFAVDEKGIKYLIEEIVVRQTGSVDFARMIADAWMGAEGGGRQIVTGYIDPANDKHEGTGRSNMDLMQEVFDEYDLTLVKAAKDRIGGAQALYNGLATRDLVICKDTCPKTWRSLKTRMHDDAPGRSGDVKKVHGEDLDDCYDMCSYGYNNWAQANDKPHEVAAKERMREMQESGMDEHSLNINAWKMFMSREAEEQDETVSLLGGRRFLRR